jgi:hypothetical protein
MPFRAEKKEASVVARQVGKSSFRSQLAPSHSPLLSSNQPAE